MAFVRELQKGKIDSDLVMSGAGTPGQFVNLTTTNKTVIATAAATTTPHGLLLERQQPSSLVNTYADGEKATVAYDGGLYETDNFTYAGLAVGDDLMFPDGAGKIGKFVAGAGNSCVGKVVALAATVLRFKLHIESTRT